MKISTKGRYALRLMADLAEYNTGENISLKDISGCANINLVIISVMYPASVASFFKNLRLAGVLKNRFSTSIDVPSGIPASSEESISPPLHVTHTPVSSSCRFVKSSTSATAPIKCLTSETKRINRVKVTARLHLTCRMT